MRSFCLSGPMALLLLFYTIPSCFAFAASGPASPVPVHPQFSPAFLHRRVSPPADEHKTLPIGSPAPDFHLKGVDGKTWSLASFKEANVLAIVFTCDHCPTAQAYEDRIIALTKDYSSKGVAVVAIMPNDPNSVSLDELGYTDLSDSYAEMKIRAVEKHFNFPYLYDGDTETTAKAYGPVATPHIFIFDKDRKLRYQGRIDDVEKPTKTPHVLDARNAIDALLSGREVPVTTTKVFGCSIKWAEKNGWVEKSKIAWAKEPVKLDALEDDGIKELLANKTDKLLLINIWSSSNEPSVSELPQFVTMNRMYRKRDFELITICMDAATGARNANGANANEALRILQKAEASCTNYHSSALTKEQLAKAVDPRWRGGLPYTLLVEPGGKIVYSKEGVIDAAVVKKAIADNPLVGRYY